MRKVHLVLTKESLRPEHHSDASAIVLDIIFATSSITAALEAGVQRIYPALNLKEAEAIGSRLTSGNWILAGEANAEPFAGYRSYDPLALSGPDMAGKDLIYATTNGTVALRRAAFFKKTYAASLRNGLAVVRHVLDHSTSEDIVLICSGSAGHFSLEDFYGGGYLVQCLRQCSPTGLIYSDSAQAAEMAFQNTQPSSVLIQSRLAQRMLQRGMGSSLDYISQIGCSAVIPLYENGSIHDAALACQPTTSVTNP